MFQILDLETAIGLVFIIGLVAAATKRNTMNWVINAILMAFLATHFEQLLYVRHFMAGLLLLVLMFTLEKRPTRDQL